MSEKIIEFNNVTFEYEADPESTVKKPPALQDVSFSVNCGEFVAVLGRNGSGKSTLANLCNAIYQPTKGTVTVAGFDAGKEENGDLIRRRVGTVFQNPDNQIVATVVEDDVAFGPENLGVEPAEIRRRVDEALKEVNMYDLRLREPHKLSGGQKQRVAIAGVLAMQTDCIVLDEPTAMLDPMGRREVMATVRRMKNELGKTVVMITHFMDEAVLADRIIVMDSGRIAVDGTPGEVFADGERVKRLGLDVPQSAQIASLLGFKQTVLTPQELVDAITERMGGERV